MGRCMAKFCLLGAMLAAMLPSVGGLVKLPPAKDGTSQVRTLQFDAGEVAVMESSVRDAKTGLTALRRAYALYNGDSVLQTRLTSETTARDVCVSETLLPGKKGTLRWFQPNTARWVVEPLTDRRIPASCVIVTVDGGGEALFYTPKVYESLGGGTLRLNPSLDGELRVTRQKNGFLLQSVAAEIPAQRIADSMMVQSSDRLFDWSSKTLPDYWKNYTLDGDGKWCFDGYYYPSPTTYVPSGKNCYYRLPAAYLCKSFVAGAADVRAAADLSMACLDTMALQQSAGGYFPTLPKSTWLSGDYGIGGGFYDTRFNTELAEIYYQMSGRVRCVEFDAAMKRYFDFYTQFASAHHSVTKNGGWLVEDYWNPTGGRRTHTALNHQLAEILTLYHFSELLSRDDLRELADRMTQAVRDTAPSWIRRDGNLHYARYPDGTYGGQDYPYLTYNDLFALRELLKTRRADTTALQTLMDAKLRWMRANGVTGYRTA